MKRLSIALVILSCAAFASIVHAVGLLPTPVLKNVSVAADTRYDTATGLYTYAYTIANPADNTGEISQVFVDVRHRAPVENSDASGLTIPMGGKRYAFDTQRPKQSLTGLFGLNNGQIVPVGENVPDGWGGGITPSGRAAFGAGNDDVDPIKPGQTRSGFDVVSRGVPTLRDMTVVPHWVLLVDSEDDVTPEDEAAAAQVRKDMRFHTVTLGPSGVPPGDIENWNQLRDDLARTIQLGWITDTGLGSLLSDQLAAARREVDARIPSLAQARLNDLLGTINAIRTGQCRAEVYALMRFNAEQLLANLGRAVQARIQPQLTVVPRDAAYNLGTTHTVTATLTNLADNNTPLVDWRVDFNIVSGPQAGLHVRDVTDAKGQAVFSYAGKQTGDDEISVGINLNTEEPIVETARALWKGGPDLAVPTFNLPELHSAGGRAFFLSDRTVNVGNVVAQASVTRYFLYPNGDMNPAEALVLGQRDVPALSPGEYSFVLEQPYIMPRQLPEGTYYLAACADAGNLIVELDETNNCSFNKVKGWVSKNVPIRTPESPPDCAQATASVATLWPPNHKLVDIAINGVNTSHGDVAAIAVTGITQDEPVNGLGDGDTAPDGFGVGTATARLRAERSGLGNGRVYTVAFTATASGGSCSGTVYVGVPRDQSHGSMPIDDGQNYDSTQR